MAYDEALAERIRTLMPGAVEKKMFGGLVFMERGNMTVGVYGASGDLLVRVGSDGMDAAIVRPGVRPFVMSGRPTKNFVIVSGDAVRTAAALRRWVDTGRRYAATLPAK